MWILFALTSATIVASRRIQEKKLVWSVWWALWWMIRVGAITGSLILWLIFSRDFWDITHPHVWMTFLVVLFLFPPQFYTYYRAMHELPFSVFGMMAPIVPITATIASIFLHNSSLTIFWGLGIFFITCWLVWLFWKHERKDMPIKYLIYGVITYMLMGIGQVVDKFALVHIGPYTYTVLNQTLMLILILIISPYLYWGIYTWFFKSNFRVIFIVWLTQWISYLCAMYAIIYAPNIGYSTAIANTHAILTALYGIFILKEEVTPRKVFVFFCMLIALISFAFA